MEGGTIKHSPFGVVEQLHKSMSYSLKVRPWPDRKAVCSHNARVGGYWCNIKPEAITKVFVVGNHSAHDKFSTSLPARALGSTTRASSRPYRKLNADVVIRITPFFLTGDGQLADFGFPCTFHLIGDLFFSPLSKLSWLPSFRAVAGSS
ncbi:hypothetical protein MPH_05363 [Macrophomina phaseolina MS6]|uniref:Uncharacterized protein n=1 Tax=Macrophomina phaseolina (strain MS6) TaxID=1126212 RepID=K2RXJ2_MACPH|nr:hypothetical protein MPH_05363 [Macrophomina phaseolina MS6]